MAIPPDPGHYADILDRAVPDHHPRRAIRRRLYDLSAGRYLVEMVSQGFHRRKLSRQLRFVDVLGRRWHASRTDVGRSGSLRAQPI